jgi:hypothetical protein
MFLHSRYVHVATVPPGCYLGYQLDIYLFFLPIPSSLPDLLNAQQRNILTKMTFEIGTESFEAPSSHQTSNIIFTKSYNNSPVLQQHGRIIKSAIG